MLLPLGDNLERPNFPIATVMLILINIAVFAVVSKMEMTGRHLIVQPGYEGKIKAAEVKEFYDTWGAVPAKLQEGQIIGVITHMFMHGGLGHLIGNMIILWVFGQSLETALGTFAFIVLYLFWGVVACLSHCVTDFSSEVFLVGASGAIAGVMGAYMTLFGFAAQIKMLFFLGPLPVRFNIPAGVFGFFWIMQQMYNASLDLEGSLTGVAWMAHVGGFMIGAVTMLIFRNQTDRVLVGDTDRRYFTSRERVAAPKKVEEQKFEPTTIEEFVEQLPARPCTTCGTEMSGHDLIGDRLLRCPNHQCAQLCYLTDADLVPSAAQA